MSGPDINNFSRRDFLFSALGIIPFASAMLESCDTTSYERIKGDIIGGASSRGHLLREKSFGTPSVIMEKSTVIVGGGVSGLSAARELKNKGITDFVLLELDERVGGNSASGENEVSTYPWGAHYLPVPDHRDEALLDFLQECGCITGFDEKGLPVYNELYLCFDPEERLYINGFWQEGLVPHFGVPEDERLQIARFFEAIKRFKEEKGTDGKDAFRIPVKLSSQDEQFRKLDQVSFEEYLKQEGLTSPYLHWYLDYCCRDDYGTNISKTSAWAGIHYFASRKGQASNTDSSTVLTWPEGNAWLVQRLKKIVKECIQTDALVYSVAIDERKKVLVDYFNFTTNRTERIRCDQAILATPQFVNKRLLAPDIRKKDGLTSSFTYAPWMVANLTLPHIPEEKGTPMSWDNVFYGSKSLGYVDATHQHVKLFSDRKVLTYYFPLADEEPSDERNKAYSKTHADWVKLIADDLRKAHPGIHRVIEHADVWLWGHGMIRPTVGFVTSGERIEAGVPIQDKIFFAHSDLSGISVFEEAFHQGIDAATQLIASQKRTT